MQHSHFHVVIPLLGIAHWNNIISIWFVVSNHLFSHMKISLYFTHDISDNRYICQHPYCITFTNILTPTVYYWHDYIDTEADTFWMCQGYFTVLCIHNRSGASYRRFTLFLGLFVIVFSMVTSSNWNMFRLTGSLHGEFTSHQWNPLTKISDMELWYVRLSAPEYTFEQTIVRLVILDDIALIMTSP